MESAQHSTTRINNIASVELLRGVAAVAVCLYHFTNGHHNFISEQSWAKAILGKGWLGVEVFFVISGFIIPFAMARSAYQWRFLPQFLLKRWLRIDPPYWLSIALVLGLHGLATYWSVAPPTVTTPQVLLHFAYLLVFVPDLSWLNGVYWTLAIEFQYYLIIAVLFPLLHHPRQLYFWLITSILLTISAYTSHPAFFFDYAAFFVLGFLLFKRIEGQFKVAFFVASALVFAFILYKFSIQYGLAAFFPWFLITVWPSLQLRFFRWLGMISYSLYLIHLPIAKKVLPWLARHLDGDGPRLVAVALLFGLTLLLAYGFFQLIERPAMRWSSAIKYQKKPQKK